MNIRKATRADALAIHNAHMASIQEVCAADYTSEQLNAWGNRPFNEAARIQAIETQNVWVVEVEDQIQGYAHLRVFADAADVMIKRAHIHGLYLKKGFVGMGVGRKIIQLMIDFCREQNVTQITLESTLTSHAFYQKIGFIDSAPQTVIDFGGVLIPCLPMHLNVEQGSTWPAK